MSDQSIITAPETDIQIARENAAFELLQRQAKMFSSSSLVPKEFIGNVANCAIGINIAKRLGADPFMVLQNIDIIHGRPSFRATFLIAMVNAAGRFEPLQFRMEGDEGKPNRSCVAWTKSKDDGATLEGPKITLEMAKAEGWSTKAGSKWITMPELMLRYRAAAFFARLYAPDVTLGLQTAEEVQDTLPPRDVTPSATTSKLLREVPAVITEPQDPPAKIRNFTMDFFSESDVAFPAIAQLILDNGLTDGIRESWDDVTLDELERIWSAREAILKQVKGGAK